MKFDKFISYYKRKNFTKKICKNCDLKTSSKPFYVFKESSTTSLGKRNFWSKLLRYVIACRFPRFVEFTFFVGFFDKKFSFVMLHKLTKFRSQTVYCPKLFSEHGESMVQIKKSRNIRAYVFYQSQVSKQNITTQNSCYSKPHHRQIKKQIYKCKHFLTGTANLSLAIWTYKDSNRLSFPSFLQDW